MQLGQTRVSPEERQHQACLNYASTVEVQARVSVCPEKPGTSKVGGICLYSYLTLLVQLHCGRNGILLSLVDSRAPINLINYHTVEELGLPTLPCITDNQPFRKGFTTLQNISITLQVGLFQTEEFSLYIISSPANPSSWASPSFSSTTHQLMNWSPYCLNHCFKNFVSYPCLATSTKSPVSSGTLNIPQKYQEIQEVFSKKTTQHPPPIIPGIAPQICCPKTEFTPSLSQRIRPQRSILRRPWLQDASVPQPVLQPRGSSSSKRRMEISGPASTIGV